MPRLTVTLSDERAERIEKMVDDGPMKSKSEAVNKLISDGEEVHQLRQKVDDLEARLDESRQREIARDKTQEEIARLRRDVETSENAPFPVRWYRWWRSRRE